MEQSNSTNEHTSETKQEQSTLDQGTPMTETSAAPKKEIDTKKGMKTAAAIIVGILIIVAGYFFMKNGTGVALNPTSNATGDVAVVNGVEISKDDYARSINNIANTATQQGADTKDPEIQSLIENQALTGLINNELLLQGATAAGITATDEDIQGQYDAIEANIGGPEALKARMEELGLNEEDVRTDIAEQLAINEFITSNIDVENITVSDEEVQTFLESVSTPDAELPPLEEIRPVIESQIISQKQQELLNDFIETLKEDAEIEILI